MTEKKWIFKGCCPEVSPLGTVLRLEVEKIQESNNSLSDEEIRNLALTNLGTRAGSVIDPKAFVELGAEQYLLKNKEVAAKIRGLVISNEMETVEKHIIMGLPVRRV